MFEGKSNEQETSQTGAKDWKGTLKKVKEYFHDKDNQLWRKDFPIKDGFQWKELLRYMLSKETAIIWVLMVSIFIYSEFIFQLINYNTIDIKIIYPILFAVTTGTIATFFVHLFRGKGQIIALWIIISVICLIFSIQLIYAYVFKVLFSFQLLGMAGDAFSEFGDDIFTAVKENIGGLIFLILPLIIFKLIIPSIKREGEGYKGVKNVKHRRRERLFLGIAIFMTYIIGLFSLNIYGRDDYTPYDLYYKSRVHDLCGKQLGIVTMTRFDLMNLVKGSNEIMLTEGDSLIMGDSEDVIDKNIKDNIQEQVKSQIEANPVVEKDDNAQGVKEVIVTPEPVDTSPNIINIDFEQLIENEKEDDIRKLHKYFANTTPTNKNEYTGMFKGYNLILITAEGFSPYAIHPTKTPTLHKLVKEGFVFNNFYTPLWQTSTSDGEYIIQTGLIPVGTRSMYRSRNNELPFVLGNQFNRLGITTKAFHNHTYTYYQRDETHPNLGYEYKGVGNGLELEHIIWPNSDLEMIQSTTKEFVKDEPFHVYYLTVSGHMNYTFVGNSISSKNKSLVADLPYSSDVRAYLACQIELDLALEELIKDLEEAGTADNTVIALTADHYPYGWEKQYLDEIAGHEVDPNFDVYRNHFILWSPSMEEKIEIDKPCSSLDILPTLSNLFGLPYDSRLLMGQDILSDASPLVILNNRSFITDKVKYNAQTGEILTLTKEVLPENYIDVINKIVRNKFVASESILEQNYYQYIMPDILSE